MDRMPKVKINTCSRWELLRLPGVGNKIADFILGKGLYESLLSNDPMYN
jgi:endonuclease III